MPNNVPDNYDMWESKEARENAYLESCLVCENCTHHIQDDSHYEIENRILCADCVDELYKVSDC